MARYSLKADGNHVDADDNALELVERHWDAIKAEWNKGWVLDDSTPKPGQHCHVWAVVWSHMYNGIELSPMP